MSSLTVGVPFGLRKQSTGSQRTPARGAWKRTQTSGRRRDVHRVPVQATPLDNLALARSNLGSWNVRGGLEGNSGKLEALVHWAGLLNLGVLGIQETMCLGITEQVITDFWGEEWSMHIGGPPLPPKRHGTGFLVSPQFEVVKFTALSARVSWIQVRFRRDRLARTGYGPIPRLGGANKADDGTACFVCAYAPTETNSSEQDLDDLYIDIQTALKDARRSGGSQEVPVVGDFNVNLKGDVGGLDIRQNVLGHCLSEGVSSPNCGRFLAFCNEEGLSVVQTREHPSSLVSAERWSTWQHPRTKIPHLKDFVLIPLNELKKVRSCRPRAEADIMNNDHSLVLCKVSCSRAQLCNLRRNFARPEHASRGKCKENQRSRGATIGRLVRGLDLTRCKRNEFQYQFRVELEKKVEHLEADWNLTEKALLETAVEMLPALKTHLPIGTWLTPTATAELGALIKQSSECRSLLSRNNPGTTSQLLDRKRGAKKAIKLCVERHKKIYRRRLVVLATRGGNNQHRQWAMRTLAKGSNFSADTKAPRRDVQPERFKEHFENLFSRKSEQETLGLTEERVGPKSEPRMELSGSPTLYEVQNAIGRLREGTAPGANGLRSELFKAGGAILSHRLCHDFRAIWPHEPDPTLGDGATGEDPQTGPGLSSQDVRSRVLQAWQDAEVVTLFKGKGARTDPSNYRGIFLLDVAGKVLATVLERRIKQAAEHFLDDSQNGFRERRSATHSVHVLRRVQEAVRVADLKSYAVFIDFEKAFDSPPRGALFECLDWIGIPRDVLTMVMAIHEDPKGKVCGSNVWFRVARGIRQGCVLGPTMFIIMLEFCLRLANLSDLGIDFRCRDDGKPGFPGLLPEDLVGVEFRFSNSSYADDVCLTGTDSDALSSALDRLQGVCGKIGLNIAVSKTEWIYLHNPVTTELEECRAKRTPLVHCCDKIKLNGVPLRHKSSFKYLGCTVSENGGVEEDTRFRVLQAQLSLNRYNGIWESGLSLRQKVRFLKSHVLPILVYGAECGNHTQREVSKISVFLNMCRRRLLNVGRRSADGCVITNEQLQRRCRLMEPMDLLARRRVNFVSKLVTRPSCEMARRLVFAEVAPQQGVEPPKKVSGRVRSSYLNVLDLDVRYLYSGETCGKSLGSILALAFERGPPFAKQMLRALKPDKTRGASLKLITARARDLVCPAMGCSARFHEQKEVNRHVRNNHPVDAVNPTPGGRGAGPGSNAPLGQNCAPGSTMRRVPAEGVISTRRERTGVGMEGKLPCPIPGCAKVFNTQG